MPLEGLVLNDQDIQRSPTIPGVPGVFFTGGQIVRLHPVARQNMTMPELVNESQWIDNLVLAATTNQSYTLPTDSAGNKGTILRIRATVGPVYINPFGGTATVPAANNLTGTGQIVIISNEHVWLDLPPSSVIGVIAATASIMSIEVWS